MTIMTDARLQLPDVTICAADSAFVPLTARALTRSMEQCAFGGAYLFSHAPVDGPFETVKINRLTSIESYSHFCLRELANFIRTPFALIVQWDGYVVNAAAWTSTFRKYDYIGAPWHGVFPGNPRLVGNGGFSLRSQRLLKAVRQLPTIGGYWEDRVICHVFGEQLERTAGIRFAPAKVADRFSYEFRVPETVPFGFHGVEHVWRHAPDAELAEALGQLEAGAIPPLKVLKLLRRCLDNGMDRSAKALYGRFRRVHSPATIEHTLARYIGAEAAAADVARFEALVQA